ncbi:hypothetical protein BC829DRAFT_410139, partial [Chytridium lagenaria]
MGWVFMMLHSLRRVRGLKSPVDVETHVLNMPSLQPSAPPVARPSPARNQRSRGLPGWLFRGRQQAATPLAPVQEM